MEKRSFILLFFVFTSLLVSSQNLVPNGGFESFTSLPTNLGQSNRATGWNNVNNVYNGGGAYATPDYYNLLGFTFPAFGSINPNSGNGQMGMYNNISATSDFREYISTQLSCPLIVGEEYELSLFITSGYNGSISGTLENLGIHFSVDQHTQLFTEAIVANPQVEISGPVNHVNFWQNYTFTFIADNPSNYITIGNFADYSTAVGNYSVYFFIDDISLIALNPTLQVNGDATVCLGESSTLSTCGGSLLGWADSLNPTNILSTNPTLTVSPSITTTYFAFNASDTAYFTVNVSSPHSVNLGNDTTLCQGDSLFLDITLPNATYQWQDNSNDSTFTVWQQGTHWVEVSLNGCVVSDTINIEFNPLPNINFGADTSICDGESLLLDITAPNATYLWQDNSTDPTFEVEQGGTYWVEITVDNCTSADTIAVSYNPFPNIELGVDTVLCENESLLLDATIPNATYLWQDNSSNSVLNITEAGTYWLEVTVNNCTSYDTIEVSFEPLPYFELGVDTTLCQFDTLTLDASVFNANYLWQDNSTTSTFEVTQPGVYWAKVEVNNCSFSDTIEVSYNPLPFIDLGEDIIECQFGNILLDANTPNASYLWSDSSTAPTLSVSQSGNYWVEVTVENCSSFDEINIQIGDCDVTIEMPNVFTPNNDGINDIFKPVYSKGITSMRIQILNRWGNLVYETDHPNIDWNGQDVNTGTYFWIINYIDIYGNENRIHGYVELLK